MPADGAAVGLGGPFPQTSVVQRMLADLDDGDQVVFEGFYLLAAVAVGEGFGKASIAALSIASSIVGMVAAVFLAIQAGQGRPCSGGRAAAVIVAGGGDRVRRVDGRASAGAGAVTGTVTIVW